ncbi:hypothetical protein L7F22_045729 [Adiantum nelumboides]|nr:hypothetical protein [Adiantum nelumboides]
MPFSDLTISPVYPTRFLNVDAKLPYSIPGLPLPCRREALQSLLLGVDSEAGFLCPGAPRMRPIAALNSAEFRRLQALESQGESDEDEDLCPVECVKEFKTRTELDEILETAKESNALVVVDFYKTACGSCKYIEQGFIKLCKGAGDDEAAVIFLKHNVSLAVLLVSPCNAFFKQTLFIAFGCLFIK